MDTAPLEGRARRLTDAPDPASGPVTAVDDGGEGWPDALVALYEEGGTGWVSDVAVAAEPEAPFAWDVRIVGDAAFARYLRSAVDYAGGRRI